MHVSQASAIHICSLKSNHTCHKGLTSHPLRTAPIAHWLERLLGGAGGWGSIITPHHTKNSEVCASQLSVWHYWVRQLFGRLGVSIMVWVIHFCSPVAELSRWLGTQKLSGVDHSAQTKQVQINSPHLHLHTTLNPPCSRWYALERLKADFKPDSHTHPHPLGTPTLETRLPQGYWT